MKRLAIVGVDITHKFIYPGFINGFGAMKMERDGEWMAEVFRGAANLALDPQVRVTAIACPDRDVADRIAGATGIEVVVESVDQLPSDLDGVLVMERKGWRHMELARPFLEQGKYVYFDKPVVETLSQWRSIVDLANRTGSRVFGGSALRYSPKMAAALTDLGERPPVSVVVTGPGPWYEYACHHVELLQMIYGSAIEGAVGVGGDGQGVAAIRWQAGGFGTVQWGPYRGEFRIDAYDRAGNGHRFYIIDDFRQYYQGLSQAIVDGVLSRIQPDHQAIAAIVGVLDQVGSALTKYAEGRWR